MGLVGSGIECSFGRGFGVDRIWGGWDTSLGDGSWTGTGECFELDRSESTGRDRLEPCMLADYAGSIAADVDDKQVSGIGKISQLLFAVLQPGNVVANIIAGGVAEVSDLRIAVFQSSSCLTGWSATVGRLLYRL